MGIPLGVWGFIPSHSFSLPRAWNVTPGLPSWLALLQALALVTNPKLKLWQPLWQKPYVSFLSMFLSSFSSFIFPPLSLSMWANVLRKKNITTFNAPIVRKRRGKELPSLSPWFSSSTSSRNKVGAGGASPLCCSLPSFSWLHTKGVTTTTESNEGKVQIKRRKKGGSWNFELIHHC